MRKNVILSLFLVAATLSCSSGETSEISNATIVEAIEKLDIEQAVVRISIDDELFYEADNEVFDTRLGVNAIFMKGSLINSQNGNIQFDFGAHDWYKKKPFSFKIAAGNGTEVSTDYGSFLIGKLNRTQTGIGEGYQLYNGKIEFQRFSKDAVILTIDGNVISPGKAQIPENFKKISGYIIINKPTVESEGLDLGKMYYE